MKVDGSKSYIIEHVGEEFQSVSVLANCHCHEVCLYVMKQELDMEIFETFNAVVEFWFRLNK